MTDEIKFKNGSSIYVNTDESEWRHVEGKSDEHIEVNMGFDSPVIPIDDHPKMIGRVWFCKVCKLDSAGVICYECKKMYNPADPDCELKD